MFYNFFIEANDNDGVVSSRGLMVIFIVGIAPIIWGIDVTQIHLELAWLKNFEVQHKERIPVIYAALILFSVYRFRLINTTTRNYCYLKCLGLFINSRLVGRWFVSKFIFNKKDHYGSYIDESSDATEVVVTANYDPETPYEKPDTFIFKVNKHGDLCAELRHSEELDWRELGVSSLWNLHFDEYCYPFDGEKVESSCTPVKSITLVILLRLARFTFSFKAIPKDVKCLDYYLPIYCNIGLATYILWDWFIK